LEFISAFRLLTFGFASAAVAKLLLLLLGASLAALAAHGASQIIAFGDNSYGQTNVPPNLTNVVAIAAGSAQRLALNADGTVVAWGVQPGGINVPVGLTNVVAIAGNGYSSLALIADGTLVAWGDDLRQTNIPPGLSSVVAVSVGPLHSLALKSDGTVVAWGDSQYGQRNVPAGLTNVVAIAAGGAHSLALKSDGTVVAWGDNQHGQRNVPAGLTNVVAIAAGGASSLALNADGTVVAWGGVGFKGIGVVPATVPSGLSNVVAIVVGGANLALKGDGTLFAWAALNFQQEIPLPGGLTNIAAIASAGNPSEYGPTAPPDGLALVGEGPPVIQASMTNPGRDTNGFNCSLPSQSGRVFRLEYKDSLADTNWTALPLVAGNGSVLTLTDSTTIGDQRFYRVRRW